MPEAQNAVYTSPAPVATSATPRRRMSWWGGIIAGAVVAAALQLLLTMFGLGIGLINLDTLAGTNEVAIGTGIWWIISGILSLLAGGWIAAHLATPPSRIDGALHGLGAWALTTLLSVWLLGSAVGNVLGGAWSVIGSSAQTVANIVDFEPAADQAEQLWQQLLQEAQTLLEQENVPLDRVIEQVQDQPIATTQQFYEALRQVVQQGLDQGTQARQEVVNFLTQVTGASEQEVQQSLDRWIQRFQEGQEEVQQTLNVVENQAQQTMEATMDTLGQAALWAFFILLLGVIAAVVGGFFGVPAHARRDDYAY